MTSQFKATQAEVYSGDLGSQKGLCNLEDRWEENLSTMPGQKVVTLSNPRKIVARQVKVTQLGMNPGEQRLDKGFYDGDSKWEDRFFDTPSQNGVPPFHKIRVIGAPDDSPAQKKQDDRLGYEVQKNLCLGSGVTSKKIAHDEQISKKLFCTDEKGKKLKKFLQKHSKILRGDLWL